MAQLDIFWSFRSPYSYLATDRLVQIVADYDVEAHFRPVRPLALREPDFFEKARPQFLPYLMLDVFREAQRLKIPIAPPRPDPVVMDLATGKVAPEQPLMQRIMALALAAVNAGRGLEFANALGKRIWGGVENWHYDIPMREAARAAGLDLRSLEDFAEGNEDVVGRVIAENESEQVKHHWGVPLMVLDGEPFFGQDRLDSLVWRLDGRDLRRS